MGWLDILKGRKSVPGADPLREALLDAAETGDEATLDRMCRNNRDRILAEFQTWQNVPKAVRADSKAAARYARGLLAVADWFASNGSPQLLEKLQGTDGDNPVFGWLDQFGKADMLKVEGHFDEALLILAEIAQEMESCQGSAVEKYLPMVHGSLGECFFRTGQLNRAYNATRAALDGCQRSGDLEGIIVYCGNLAQICRERGEVDEAKYWLIVTTNGMIQTGQVERAAQLRRDHGLEPTAGLIEAKGPLG